MHTVYLSLGANIGNRKGTIREVIKRISQLIGNVEKLSSLYETEPWGYDSPNKFINATVCVSTSLTPHEVLNTTQEIEIKMGRTTKSKDGEYQDRIIDIDILLYDDIKLNDKDLKIPHPLMYEREFVMTPLREIMPY